jgi:hypothetical protein
MLDLFADFLHLFVAFGGLDSIETFLDVGDETFLSLTASAIRLSSPDTANSRTNRLNATNSRSTSRAMPTTVTRCLKVSKPSATLPKPRYDIAANTAVSASTTAKPIMILVLILRLVKNPNRPDDPAPADDNGLLTMLFLRFQE